MGCALETRVFRTDVSPASRPKENCVNEAMWLIVLAERGDFEPAVGVLAPTRALAPKTHSVKSIHPHEPPNAIFDVSSIVGF